MPRKDNSDLGESYCFSGGTIISGDDMLVMRQASLTVDSGRIVQIGHPVAGVRQIDMQGKLLCPMFINAHIHLGDTGAKDLGIGLPLEQAVNPPDGLKHRFLNSLEEDEYIAMMRHGLQEMLLNGIIACADFREQGMKGIRALRKAAAGLPCRTVILARMTEGSNAAQLEKECYELLTEADGIGVRDVTSYETNLLKQFRQNYSDKIFAVHASEDFTAETVSMQQYGKGQTARNIDWGPDFMVHLVHTPADDLKMMAQSGIRGVSCARANGILGDGMPDLAMWKQQGVSFALGTDNVMFNSIDMMREMDFASRLIRGLHRHTSAVDSLTMLKAATIEGARILRLDGELGSLSAGKEASFIVFDLNSMNLKYSHDVINALVHRAGTADIDDIVVCGKSVKKTD